MRISELMCKDICFVKPDCNTYDASRIMRENHIGCIPICDDSKKIVGIVTDRDILLRTVACNKDVKTTPVSEIMTTDVWCCGSNEQLDKAQEIMSANQVRRLPVTENGKIVGILSIGDISRNPNTNQEAYVITFDNICKGGNKNNA